MSKQASKQVSKQVKMQANTQLSNVHATTTYGLKRNKCNFKSESYFQEIKMLACCLNEVALHVLI